jgi:hypothetical protein
MSHDHGSAGVTREDTVALDENGVGAFRCECGERFAIIAMADGSALIINAETGEHQVDADARIHWARPSESSWR